MGRVYRAYDRRLDRDVAIKHVHPDKASEKRARRRLRKEARATAALAHSAIVPVFDFVETESEGDWIVMELVEGQTVAELIERGPLDLPAVLEIATGVADGLAYAHSRGFVHRDLKSENVMLSNAGKVRILDFGLAKEIHGEDGSLSVEGAVVGTCRAMSPEQALGRSVDGRSDFFSLGILLYECLTAESPFRGGSAAATLMRICTLRQTPVTDLNASVPQPLSDLVDDLMEKAPEHRPESGDVLARVRALVLEADSPTGTAAPALFEATIDDERPGFGHWVGKGSQPKKAVVAVSVFLAAVVAIAMWTLWGGSLPGLGSQSRTESATQLASVPGDEHSRTLEGLRLLEDLERPGDLDRALQLFSALVEDEEATASAHAGHAKALFLKSRRTGDKSWLDPALEAATKAVERGEFVALSHAVLGSALLKLGKTEEALASFDTAFRLDPTCLDAYLGIALHHEARNETVEAEEAYRRALEIKPTNRVVLDRFGSLLFKASRLDEAEEIFERSIEAAPGDVFGYANLAGVFFMRDDLEAAAATLQRGLEVRKHSYLFTNLGNILFYQGFYEQSIEPFSEAVKIDQGRTDHLMWANLGDAYRWTTGREEDLEAAYQMAIDLVTDRIDQRPSDPTLLTQRALYRARQGDWAGALEEARDLKDNADLPAATRYLLVMVFEQAGERSLALESLEQALELGYPLAAVEREQELDRLRADPAFEAISRSIREAS